MFCNICGKEVVDTAEICPNCGTRVRGKSTVDDTPSTIANIVSLCCFPLLGIILYFVWKDNKPKSASSVIKYALGGIAISILGGIILGALGVLGSAVAL